MLSGSDEEGRFGGTERVLGTNPLAIAIPKAGDHPILLDMATSAQSGSRVRQAAYYDEDIPEAPDELDTPTFLRKQMD